MEARGSFLCIGDVCQRGVSLNFCHSRLVPQDIKHSFGRHLCYANVSDACTRARNSRSDICCPAHSNECFQSSTVELPETCSLLQCGKVLPHSEAWHIKVYNFITPCTIVRMECERVSNSTHPTLAESRTKSVIDFGLYVQAKTALAMMAFFDHSVHIWLRHMVLELRYPWSS